MGKEAKKKINKLLPLSVPVCNNTAPIEKILFTKKKKKRNIITKL